MLAKEPQIEQKIATSEDMLEQAIVYAMLGNYIDFTNKDVLFLYSTLVLNNSETLK